MSDWRDAIIKDLREIGVVVESCLGCGKISCDSCPAGTSTTIDLDKLAPDAAKALRKIWNELKA